MRSRTALIAGGLCLLAVLLVLLVLLRDRKDAVSRADSTAPVVTPRPVLEADAPVPGAAAAAQGKPEQPETAPALPRNPLEGQSPAEVVPAPPTIDLAPTGGLRVLVVDESEVPVGNAVVTLARYGPGKRPEERFEQSTGPDGNVVFEQLTPARWGLGAVAGKMRKHVRIDVVAGKRGFQKLVLPRVGAVLTGVVRHKQHGPLAGATVSVYGGEASPSSKADEEGRYRIEEIPPGEYRISIWSSTFDHYSQTCGELRVVDTRVIRRDLLVGEVCLTGVVRDAVTGRPLPGVAVRLQDPVGRTSNTDADGTYRLCDVTASSGKLVVVRKGYELLFVDLGKLVAGEARVRDIELHPSAALHVHVTDEGGRPIVGALRLLWDGHADPSRSISTHLETDGDGRGVYRKIRPGRYNLAVRHDGVRSDTKEFEVRAGRNHIHFEIPIAGEELPRSLSGTVTEAATGKPIPGARVWVKSRPRRSAYADAAGRYCVKGLAAGKYMVFVTKDGYGRHVFHEVRITGGGESIRDAALKPAATLQLVLRDANGRPVSGRMHFVARGETTTGSFVEADEGGVVTCRQILPGTYDLEVHAGEQGEGKTSATIVMGENTVEVTVRR